MEALSSCEVCTDHGVKSVEVYHADVCKFSEPIDILTTSAFRGSYIPMEGTVFHALDRRGISVQTLAKAPMIDLRQPCHIWLSREVEDARCQIGRIGCVELLGEDQIDQEVTSVEGAMLDSIRAYFAMLDMAAIYGVPMQTVALPLLGSGDQNISAHLMLVPLIRECVAFLKRNRNVRRICFIERDLHKARMIGEYVMDSYQLMQAGALKPVPEQETRKQAFISYSSGDLDVARSLCEKLEARGVSVWYAKRDCKDAYAGSIVEALEKSQCFILILSRNSLASQHVLNEIDLAFQRLPDGITFKLFRVDPTPFPASFRYYLSRQNWVEAYLPPMEERLEEFADYVADPKM